MTVALARRVADMLLTAGRKCLGNLITPTEVSYSGLDLPNIEQVIMDPDWRWFDCPSYEHCLHIACVANWKSWTCAACPVMRHRPNPSDDGLEPSPPQLSQKEG